jgi:beta-glucosidase
MTILTVVDGVPRIKHGQVAGKACEHYRRYKEDIQLMKDIGVTSYRFSVEWSKIEVSCHISYHTRLN